MDQTGQMDQTEQIHEVNQTDQIDEVNQADQTEQLDGYSVAIQNLLVWSFLLFTIPIALVYGSYRIIFKDQYEMSDADASLYGGIVGVFAVYVIVIGFVVVAYREEKETGEKLKRLKAQ